MLGVRMKPNFSETQEYGLGVKNLRPPALADGRSHCGCCWLGRSAEGDPAQEAWGAESARTPAAIMLEKVNLHLEALRMPTANHDVEVHLARQAIRALSEAVSRDAGETIAAMKLHRRVRSTAALRASSRRPRLALRSRYALAAAVPERDQDAARAQHAARGSRPDARCCC